MRARRATLALALVLVPAGACTVPEWSRASPSPAPSSGEWTRPSVARTAAPTVGPPDPAQNEVAVRLDSLENPARIELRQGGSDLVIRREGSEVVATDGRRGPWILVRESPGRIDLDGLSYTGSLLVAPDVGTGLSVENRVDLEDYVRGVVAGELSIWSAPPALLEAQAIAARSYARSQLVGRPGKPPRGVLSDTTRDQAYRGEYVPSESAASAEVDARLRAAVETTRGIVLSLGGHTLDARFHAACGGTTAAFEGVFDEPDPGGMAPVSCTPCRRLAEAGDANVAWTFRADPAAVRGVAAALDVGTRLVSIQPARTNDHGRWMESNVVGDRGSALVSATELRRLFGWTNLKSAWITSTPASSSSTERIVFEGLGRGHGVGMCQTGARRLAEAEFGAADILAHYFPRARLSRVVKR